MDSHDLNQAMLVAINYLGLNLYKELSKENSNVFISPFSISSALSMAFIGSSSETAREMSSVLGYEKMKLESENVESSFKYLLSEINKALNMYTLNTANVVLSDKKFTIKEKFRNGLINFFEALFVDADFVNGSAEALEKVNDWVKTKTNGMVPHLLESLDSSTVLCIVNTVYFKGLWLHAFKEKSTFMQYFYNYGCDQEANLVEMMHLKERFFMSEDVSYKALELPYKGENLSMLVLLPNSRNGVEELEKQITVEFLKTLKDNMKKIEVEVAFPKLHLNYSKSLKNDFQNLGMKQAFSRGANFDKISDSDNLYISEIIHKAVIDVTEEGTEAAAATAVMVNRYCRLTNCPEFIVDHPFLFFIKDFKNDLILFMGRVVEL